MQDLWRQVLETEATGNSPRPGAWPGRGLHPARHGGRVQGRLQAVAGRQVRGRVVVGLFWIATDWCIIIIINVADTIVT